jgi:hypothetical protein
MSSTTDARTRARSDGPPPPQSSPQSLSPQPAVRERLPLPTRERKPALAALAVLLILLGAAISAVLVLRSGDRVGVLALRDGVTAGEEISREKLAETQVAVSDQLPVIPTSELESVLGTRAASDLPARTILTRDMITQESMPPPGSVVVSLSLPPGRIPGGVLEPGDLAVAILAPPPGAQLPEGLTVEGSIITSDARVFTLRNDDVSGTLVVSLLVDDSRAQALTQAAALESVTLVKAPDAGAG